MPSEIRARLALRSAVAALSLPDPLAGKLVTYFELLQRWNRKINLTALSNLDDSIDRLLLEPVAAAAALPHFGRLIDLGSGGGSPAIPLALATSASLLVMVESRSRKAAFLREAIRELELNGRVENARFEELSGRPEHRHANELVSIRAVRIDSSGLTTAATFLAPGGRIGLFESLTTSLRPLPVGLSLNATVPLLQNSRLTVLRLG